MKNRRSRPFKRSNNRNNDNFANGNNNTRVRGNLSTVLEKYKVLAKDAAASGEIEEERGLHGGLVHHRANPLKRHQAPPGAQRLGESGRE